MSKLFEDKPWHETINALAQGSDMCDAFDVTRLVNGCEYYRNHIRPKDLPFQEVAELNKVVLPVWRRLTPKPKLKRLPVEQIIEALIEYARSEATWDKGHFTYRPELLPADSTDPEADMMERFAFDFEALLDVLGGSYKV